MANSKQMTGKRVLVTGAARGIGKEVALEFCRRGADVVFHYPRSSEQPEKAIEQAKKEGARKVKAIQADFSLPHAPGELAQASLEFLGGIDILVNNASITMNLDFNRVTPEQFDFLYSVNVRAMFFLIQALAPSMIEAGGGVVINFSSIHAIEGSPEHSVYASTKGAITALSRQLAIELAPKGIRVNSIAPGAVEVEKHHEVIPNYDPKAMGNLIPAGFVGQPTDIASVVCFLASDEARYIIGQNLVIDGGTSSWMPFSDNFRKPIGSTFGKGDVPGL